MKVYRLEHKEYYCGAYNTYELMGKYGKEFEQLKYKLVEAHRDVPTHPTVWKDFESEVTNKIFNRHFIFGCPTFDSLFEWFDGFLEDYLKFDFVIAEYEVDEQYCFLGKSGRQVTFNSNKARRVNILEK